MSTLTADQMDMVRILENHTEQMDKEAQSLDARSNNVRMALARGDWNELERILDQKTENSEVGDGSTTGNKRSGDSGHGENSS